VGYRPRLGILGRDQEDDVVGAMDQSIYDAPRPPEPENREAVF
jgi:hypothetical protein